MINSANFLQILLNVSGNIFFPPERELPLTKNKSRAYDFEYSNYAHSGYVG